DMGNTFRSEMKFPSAAARPIQAGELRSSVMRVRKYWPSMNELTENPRPAPAKRVPVVSIGFATQLWIQWAWIGLNHRDEARLSRAEGSGPPAGNAELQAAMVAISAAAFALDGLATDIVALGEG